MAGPAGPVGPKGDNGSAGEPGPKGDSGPRGEPWAMVFIWCLQLLLLSQGYASGHHRTCPRLGKEDALRKTLCHFRMDYCLFDLCFDIHLIHSHCQRSQCHLQSCSFSARTSRTSGCAWTSRERRPFWEAGGHRTSRRTRS